MLSPWLAAPSPTLLTSRALVVLRVSETSPQGSAPPRHHSLSDILAAHQLVSRFEQFEDRGPVLITSESLVLACLLNEYGVTMPFCKVPWDQH